MSSTEMFGVIPTLFVGRRILSPLVERAGRPQMRYFVSFGFLLLSALFATAVSPVSPIVNNNTINYSLSPNRITINGSGFQPSTAVPAVLFNNVNLALVSSSNTQIVANLPANTQA